MALKANTGLFAIRVTAADDPARVVGYAIAQQVEMIPNGKADAYGRESIADFERLFAGTGPTFTALPYHGEQDEGGHYVAFAAGSPPKGPGN